MSSTCPYCRSSLRVILHKDTRTIDRVQQHHQQDNRHSRSRKRQRYDPYHSRVRRYSTRENHNRSRHASKPSIYYDPPPERYQQEEQEQPEQEKLAGTELENAEMSETELYEDL